MQLISRLSTATEFDLILHDLTHNVHMGFDLGILFISQFDKSSVINICNQLKHQLNITQFIGCSSSGIVGSNREIEGKPACSMILGNFNDVIIQSFHCDQGQLNDLKSKEQWYEFVNVYPNEKPQFFMLADPFQIDLNQFLNGINDCYPGCPVVGGLASGSSTAKGNILILNNQYYDEGLIGLFMTGNIQLGTVVSQGCRPIGESYIVTRSDRNIIHELAAKPFLDVLDEVLTKGSERERALAQEAIFVGVVIDEYKHELKRGDFLIRMLLGIDEGTGAGVIGDTIHTGQTIQFHIRDAISATEDLHALLNIQKNKNLQQPQGAVVFSCNGRGENLFHEKNHDLQIIQKHLGEIPLTGVFCAGEIGPVAGKNFIHGFTSSIALFYPKK